jgi:hypothetical protein
MSKHENYDLVEYMIPNLLTSKEYQQTSLFPTKEKCIYALQVEEKIKVRDSQLSYRKVMY